MPEKERPRRMLDEDGFGNAVKRLFITIVGVPLYVLIYLPVTELLTYRANKRMERERSEYYRKKR